jgi:hypothetical protein
VTIADLFSVAELKDLLTAKDYDLTQMGDHYAAFSPTWVNSDNATFLAWTNDWNALNTAYAAAKSDAQTIIDEAEFIIGSDATISADSQYRAVLSALNSTWAQNTPAPGSIIDLEARLATASGQATDYSTQPQPTPGTDADLDALNAVSPYDVIGGAGGGTNVTQPTTWPFWMKATGTVVVGGVALYVAYKFIDVAASVKKLLT